MEAKPLASLSPGLLARKGAARPAMRPQLQSVHSYRDALARAYDGADQPGAQPHDALHDATIDDLGWNDMGHDDAADHTPENAPEDDQPQAETAEPSEPAPSDPAPRAALTPAPKRKPKAAPARRSALKEGRRAAFTLRLDATRHLKLRLACTLDGRSAQALLIAALDDLLDDYPGLDALAEQVRQAR